MTPSGRATASTYAGNGDRRRRLPVCRRNVSPPGLTRWGFLKRISLRLHRNYTFHGQHRTYLSAPCEAPGDLKQAYFPFVFAEMDFEDGRELSATLTRSCRVKGR